MVELVMRRKFSVGFISLIMLFCFAFYASGLETVGVPPLGGMTWTLELYAGDIVNGSISANPALGAFYVEGPNEENVLPATPMLSTQPVPFSFSASVPGLYALDFRNFDFSRTTEVTLDYTIRSSFFGVLNRHVSEILLAILLGGLVLATFLYVRARADKSRRRGLDSVQLEPRKIAQAQESQLETT